MLKVIASFLKEYAYPGAVFMGGTIGVGFLALPYVASKVGIWVMLAYMIVMAVVIASINIIFAKISAKTPDFKRFPGFVGYYFGEKAQWLVAFSLIFVNVGVLLVYIMVGGQMLTEALSPYVALSFPQYALVFFAIAASILFFDIKLIARAELFILLFFAAALVLAALGAFLDIHPTRALSIPFRKEYFFWPYGPLLFSLWGINAIPSVEEMVKSGGKDVKKRLHQIMIISPVILAGVYFAFTAWILSITGAKVHESALMGLGEYLNPNLVFLALLAGVMVLLNAFIAQGNIVKEILMYDLKVKPGQAFTIAVAAPFVFFFLGLASFVPLVSFIGGLLLGADALLILFMYKEIGGKSWLVYPLAAVLVLGGLYEIWHVINQIIA